MIVVSPRFLVSAVQDSVKMGAKGIIIITAGLGETGDTGKDIEKKIMEEASGTGTFVIGPNCSGMFSAAASMNMLGVAGYRQGAYLGARPERKRNRFPYALRQDEGNRVQQDSKRR